MQIELVGARMRLVVQPGEGEPGHRLAARRARRRDAAADIVASATLSSTVWRLKGRGIWYVREMPARAMRCAARPTSSCPSKTMLPRSHVVAADEVDEGRLARAVGASRPRISPRRTSTSTPASASRAEGLGRPRVRSSTAPERRRRAAPAAAPVLAGRRLARGAARTPAAAAAGCRRA